MHDIKKYLKEVCDTKKRILCNVLSEDLVTRLSTLDCDFFVFTSEENKKEIKGGSNVFVLPVNDLFPILDYDAIVTEYKEPEDVRMFRQFQDGFKIPMLSIFNFSVSKEQMSQNLASILSVMAGTISITKDKNTAETITSLGCRAVDSDLYNTNILEQILLNEEKNEPSN